MKKIHCDICSTEIETHARVHLMQTVEAVSTPEGPAVEQNGPHPVKPAHYDICETCMRKIREMLSKGPQLHRVH